VRRRLAIIAVVIAAFVCGGIAWASIPGPDGVIHGCYKTSNPAQGALIAIDSAASCPSGYAALNWNQTGPQGPSGVSGYQIAEGSVDIPANYTPDKVTVSVSCPSGTKPLGGGGAGPETDDGVWVLYASGQLSSGGVPLGWYVRLKRLGSVYGSATTAFAWAICASVT